MSTAVATPPAPPAAPTPTTTYPIKEPWLSKRTNQMLVVLAVWIDQLKRRARDRS